MSRIHVDREPELDLFDDLLAGRRAERILLLEGSSQMGKSSLLVEFSKRCGACRWALVNFKGISNYYQKAAMIWQGIGLSDLAEQIIQPRIVRAKENLGAN